MPLIIWREVAIAGQSRYAVIHNVPREEGLRLNLAQRPKGGGAWGIEEARAALATAKTWWGPNYDPGFLFPWLRPEDDEHVLEGYRKAGWEG